MRECHNLLNCSKYFTSTARDIQIQVLSGREFLLCEKSNNYFPVK